MRDCVASKEKGSSSSLRVCEGPVSLDAVRGSLACGRGPPRHTGRLPIRDVLSALPHAQQACLSYPPRDLPLGTCAGQGSGGRNGGAMCTHLSDTH